MSYSAIIEAISKDMCRRHGLVELPAGRDASVITSDIIEHQQLMPDYLRWPMRVLTWIFDTWGLVATGTRFQNMTEAGRAEQINSWKKSRLLVCRNFVRFYESLFLLIALQEGPS